MANYPQQHKYAMSASRDVMLSERGSHVVITETLSDGNVVDWHSHEFAQILWPLKGVVTLVTSDWLCVTP
jgi:quercetin dioxygenase-like cupin family protein